MKVISYLWQLPQNLIGLLLLAIYKGNDSEYDGVKVRRSVYMHGGISLGKYIIINQWSRELSLKHELGHSIQSLRLGWLYLLVIGIPSLIWAAIYGVAIRKTHNGYYRFYTEKWADKLGNIKR